MRVCLCMLPLIVGHIGSGHSSCIVSFFPGGGCKKSRWFGHVFAGTVWFGRYLPAVSQPRISTPGIRGARARERREILPVFVTRHAPVSMSGLGPPTLLASIRSNIKSCFVWKHVGFQTVVFFSERRLPTHPASPSSGCAEPYQNAFACLFVCVFFGGANFQSGWSNRRKTTACVSIPPDTSPFLGSSNAILAGNSAQSLWNHPARVCVCVCIDK